MNAIDFLIKEHNRVKTMLTDISDNSHDNETQKKQFAVLSKELLRHEAMEHAIWYPHFKNTLPKSVGHLLKEEKSAASVIKKLDSLNTKEAWEAHFLKFKKDVLHHAQEEENKLFPEVKTILSEKELEKIGVEMYAFKKKHS